MLYEKRVLAYIDILGFKDAVGKTVENINDKETENRCKIEEIHNLLDDIRYQLIKDKFMPIKKIEIKDRVVSQFSDSVVISYLENVSIYNILQDIYFLCISALGKGFLFRGAVVCGKVIHTENKLFGPAFIKAYDMEQKQAIFPRVIIDKDIFYIAKDNYSKCTDLNAEYNSLLKLIPCDFDGKRYINYIDKYYTGVGIGEKEEQEHRIWLCNIIKEIKKKIDENNEKDNLICKYLWLKGKFINGDNFMQT
jgi:hypothetical protein